MKAWSLASIGNIELIDKDIPSPKSGEVLVKVKACGVCGSDIPRIYQNGAHKMPLTIGHEFSGEVADVASGISKDWIGKRVGIFPLIPCKECPPCRAAKYEMCRHYDYLGSRSDGGFAQYVCVPEWNLIELPDNVSFEAAAMLEPMAVAVHSMRQVKIEADDTILIIGAGTIGILLTMFLIDSGIKNVLVVGNKSFQKEQLTKIGLPEVNYFDSKSSDISAWVMSKTSNSGADICFDCVGKSEIYSECISLARPGGQVVLVGNPYSDMKLDQNIYWKILRNQLTLHGTWNSSFTKEETDDWHYVINRLAKESIHPDSLISHRFSIGDIDTGFRIMKNKSEDYLKIMMIND